MDFPSGLRTISQTSFPMINCYSLNIASSIAGRVCTNDVAQLCHSTRVCLRPLTLVWKSHHTFIHLELFLVPKMVFISRGGSTSLLYSSEALFFVMVSMTLGDSSSYSCMFIGMNIDFLSLDLQNKSHPFLCRILYAIFPTSQMHHLHGYKHLICIMTNSYA